MKKKSGVGIFLLTIATAGVIFSGLRYKKAQQQELAEKSILSASAVETDRDKDKAEGPETTEDKLTDYQARLSELSPFEYLDYKYLSEGSATMAFYGDLNEEDGWLANVEAALASEIGSSVEFSHHVYPDLDTYELHIQQTAYQFAEQAPDVLVFRPSPAADRIRDIGLAETEEYMGHVIEALKSSLKDTKIVMLETYPQPGAEEIQNSRSLTYGRYAETMRNAAEKNGIEVLSLTSEMQEKMEEGEISSFYEADQTTLNQNGQQLYSELILEQLRK